MILKINYVKEENKKKKSEIDRENIAQIMTNKFRVTAIGD